LSWFPWRIIQSELNLNVELVLETQRPQLINGGAIRVVRETMATLPLGQFIGWNQLSGGSLGGGQVF